MYIYTCIIYIYILLFLQLYSKYFNSLLHIYVYIYIYIYEKCACDTVKQNQIKSKRSKSIPEKDSLIMDHFIF